MTPDESPLRANLERLRAEKVSAAQSAIGDAITKLQLDKVPGILRDLFDAAAHAAHPSADPPASHQKEVMYLAHPADLPAPPQPEGERVRLDGLLASALESIGNHDSIAAYRFIEAARAALAATPTPASSLPPSSGQQHGDRPKENVHE